MGTLGRSAAGFVGLGTIALFLYAEIRAGFALEAGLTFVGGLIGVALAKAQLGSLRWYQTIRRSIVGALALLLFYVLVASPSPTIPWALGFGTSNGLIFGSGFALILYAFCSYGNHTQH